MIRPAGFGLGLALVPSVAAAQTTEFQVLALSQKANAEGRLPATTYKPAAFLFIRDFGPGLRGGALQWAFGAVAGASQRAHYEDSPVPPPSYGGSSRTYSPGGAVVAGLRYRTTGAVQFRTGLDFRFNSESDGGSSGDTASQTRGRFAAKRWFVAELVWSPNLGSLRGSFGFHAGFSDASAPAPNRETGFFAGLRFGPRP